jgi:hypothetical protein
MGLALRGVGERLGQSNPQWRKDQATGGVGEIAGEAMRGGARCRAYNPAT